MSDVGEIVVGVDDVVDAFKKLSRHYAFAAHPYLIELIEEDEKNKDKNYSRLCNCLEKIDEVIPHQARKNLTNHYGPVVDTEALPFDKQEKQAMLKKLHMLQRRALLGKVTGFLTTTIGIGLTFFAIADNAKANKLSDAALNLTRQAIETEDPEEKKELLNEAVEKENAMHDSRANTTDSVIAGFFIAAMGIVISGYSLFTGHNTEKHQNHRNFIIKKYNDDADDLTPKEAAIGLAATYALCLDKIIFAMHDQEKMKSLKNNGDVRLR